MPFEIIPAGTRIDFISKRRICAGLSAAVLLASMMAVPVRGVRLGIDFAGGTEIQVRMSPDSDAEEGGIREIVGQIPGVEGLSVVRYGAAERDEFLLKFRGDLEAGEAEAAAEEAGAPAAEEEPEAIAAEEAGAPAAEGEASSPAQDVVAEVQSALSRAYGDVEIERVEFVGPRVGEELRADGMWALLLASIAILIYIAFRFSSRFAPGAIVAVLHDLLITAGIFVILGLEFDLSILAAMLAILGYSLNDTIIIYDRIRENMSIRTKVDLPDVLNESINQTLSRTVLTSGTTLLALLSLFFLGGEVIRPFAFAMIVGIFVGTYSSIYIAAPVLLLLEQRVGLPATASEGTPSRPAGRSGKSGKQPKKGRARKARAASAGDAR